MPHVAQSAVVRVLQALTDARNIVPGDRVPVRPHILLMGPRDGLAALKAFRIAGHQRVAEPERIILFTPDNLPLDAAGEAARKQLLEAARQAGITRLIPAAGGEVAHALESGLVAPGECAASGLPEIHALGGFGALGLRLTALDLAQLMAGKPVHVTVPETVRVDLTGQRQKLVGGRDVFWSLRREAGRNVLAGRALEVGGPGLEGLQLHERAALSSLGAHGGLFSCFCVPDRGAVTELNRVLQRPYTTLEPEKGAQYAHRAEVSLANAQLTVIPPDGADAWRTISEASGEPLDCVVIGGEGSGSLHAMRLTAEIVRQRKLGHTRCVAIPDTRAVYASALDEGIVQHLVDAGVEVHAPGTSAAGLVLPMQRAMFTTVTAPQGAWRAGIVAAATAACAGAIMHPDRLDAQPQRDSKLSSRRPKAE